MSVGCDTSSGGEKDGGVAITTPAGLSYNSIYFEQIVFDQPGEFVGLNLGDSREAVLGSLPAEALGEE